jgi:predicted ATPase/class 3 adenylate cyclase
MSELPTGTVTFLFTDLEGSTRLWQEHPDAMRAALARHDEILRNAVAGHEGYVVKTTGDGIHAAFPTAHAALDAAVAMQHGLAGELFSETGPLRVRMGLHTCEVQSRDGDYYGSEVNRAARLMSVAHGGQLLMSDATAALLRDGLPGGVELWPLGQHRLRDLAEPIAVFQVAAPGLAREFPPLQSLDAFPGNLPAQLSSFVGRERDVTDVAELLSGHRLVTLTGVGGVGKTRLALQAASEVLPRFPDGAWLVELAKVRDPAAVADAVAAGLGAPSRPELSALEVLTRFLRTKRVLVVLDNCEHLLDAAAELVRSLEQACPDLVVLATSREGLGVRGEQNVTVRSLGAGDAKELFVARAVATRSDFTLTDTNAAAVAEVCRRLDGIPLAIELAAARVAALSPAQLAARLDQRFALLAGGERGAVERHATLRAAIDWSYELLEPAEQLMLARLSVFAGGCTLEAAEAVCADGAIDACDVIDLLSSLVARSLVTIDVSDPEETWYRLLETIRQYAEEQLDPNDRLQTCDRHVSYYAGWLTSAAEHLRGPDQADWVARAEHETENARAAITWAVNTEKEPLAFEMLVAVDLPPMHSLPVGRVVWAAAEQVLELQRAAATGDEHLPRAVALGAMGAVFRGQLDRARALYEEAAALDDGTDDNVAFDLLGVQNNLALLTGDVTQAMEANAGTLRLVRRLDRTIDIAGALAGLAAQHAASGDFDAAQPEAAEALELARRTGAPSIIAMAQAALAFAMIGSDPEAARTHLRALASPAALPPWSDTPVEAALAMMMVCGARLGELEPTLIAGARVLDDTPSTPLIIGAVLETAAAVLTQRAPDEAATLRGAADTITPGFADVLALRGNPADATSEQTTPAYQTGQRMTEDEATAFARTLIRDALTTNRATRLRH